MTDIVVTVPKNFKYKGRNGLEAWISEGDPAGSKWSGREWYYTIGRYPPKIEPGERVYIIYNGLIRGYAPLLRIERMEPYDDGFTRLGQLPMMGCALVRGGGAVAVTIPRIIKGFQGYRYRTWSYEDEVPFPHWQDPNVTLEEAIHGIPRYQ